MDVYFSLDKEADSQEGSKCLILRSQEISVRQD